jgi:SAM-dependent methyltransferase
MSRATAEARIRELAPRRILDVATGRGGCIGWLIEALDGFSHLAGIDISTETLCQTAMDFPHEEVDLAGMCATKLGFRSDSFDLVAIVNSVHHLCSPAEALREMVRVLRPGGLLLICEMLRDEQNERQMSHVLVHHWWADIDRVAGVPHSETFNRKQLLDLVNSLGMLDLDVVEDERGGGQQVDERTMEFLKDTIDGYSEKIAGKPEYQAMRNRGRELRQRLDEVGFAWARGVTIIGSKPAL